MSINSKIIPPFRECQEMGLGKIIVCVPVVSPESQKKCPGLVD